MSFLVHLHTMTQGVQDQWPTEQKLFVSGCLLGHIQQLLTKATLKTYLHKAYYGVPTLNLNKG